MKKLPSVLLSFMLFVPAVLAQTGVTMRYGEADGLSHRHVTQILQDRNGFIWLSTWNGLDRFDGREFVTFKSRAGDGVDMPSDRFRNLAIDDRNPDIINCRVDDNWFRFSLLTGRFCAVSNADALELMKHPGHGQGTAVKGGGSNEFRLRDRQGLLWNVLGDGISMSYTLPYPIVVQHWDNPAVVKAISVDSIGRIWVASKEDRMVRIYNKGIVSYLTPDGTLSAVPVAFGSAVYSICQGPETGWDVWLGSKPDGLFRLHREGSGYSVTHLKKGDGGLPAGNIYGILVDSIGRLWLATMDAGLVCCDHGHWQTIRFGRESKARRVFQVNKNTIVATTTEGFLVVDCTPGRPMKWLLHRREANRTTSLSNNACMDFATSGGKWFVSTESGGINGVEGNSLAAGSLSFRHYDEDTGLGSDVILAIVPVHGGGANSPYGNYSLLAVTSNSLILLNPETGESRELSGELFRQQLAFSDAEPCYSHGKWYFGLDGGLAIIDEEAFRDDGTDLPIVLTSVTVESRRTDYMVNQINEVTLSPGERTVAVAFAVLDYRNPRNIRYAYRVNGDSTWQYLGKGNVVRLSELAPGDYSLELRATDAMGKWNPRTRTLRIVVEPKFTETVWFQLLLLLVVVGLIIAVVLTRRYVKNIQRKQKETLDAYLALLEKSNTVDESVVFDGSSIEEPQVVENTADDELMSRIVAFVEEHMMDSEVTVDDMASAAAVSRSSLNRKMKSLVGVTPADFLREARVKHACVLLRTTASSVADVAYKCGFTDPKYFSRIFRQTVGKSPTDYRSSAQS